MRMKARSASVSAFSRLLASICLRYGVAKPSVWPRKRGCNRRQFSDFRSDSRLNFTTFGCRFGDVGDRSGCAGSLCCNRVRLAFRYSRSSRLLDALPFISLGVCLVWSWAGGLALIASQSGNRFTHEFAIQIWPRVRLLDKCGTGSHVDGASASRVGPGSVLIVGALERPSRTDRKELNMYQSRGAVSFTRLFTTDDIGLRKDASVEHVVKVFLTVGEAIATRWIEMPRGILLLQTVPDQAASGAIYLYDRERQIFFFVDFVSGRNDALTAIEFDQLVAEYDLVSWTANPAQLPTTISGFGLA